MIPIKQAMECDIPIHGNTDSYKFHLRIGFIETECCIFFKKDIELEKKPSVIYRPMSQPDIDCIHVAFKSKGWPKPREVLEKYYREQENGERTVIVAEIDGNIAGYVTLLPEAKKAMPYYGKNIPEIKDFFVFEKFRRCGIGNGLMDEIEVVAAGIAETVCFGVGLHSGYGAAQRMYVKRGYIPDGSGAWDGTTPANPYGIVENGDDLVLYMSKKLR